MPLDPSARADPRQTRAYSAATHEYGRIAETTACQLAELAAPSRQHDQQAMEASATRAAETLHRGRIHGGAWSSCALETRQSTTMTYEPLDTTTEPASSTSASNSSNGSEAVASTTL